MSDDEGGRARDAAFRLLAVRPRTVSEMRRRLAAKDVPRDVVDDVVTWLLERDLLDDAAFARQFLEDRLRRRPRGPFGLVRELRKRGVDGDLARRAVDELLAERGIDEEDIARDTARRWLARQSPRIVEVLGAGEPRDEAERLRARLYAHLERKGFRRHVALEVVEEVRRGTGELGNSVRRGAPEGGETGSRA